jgi:acyl-CoA thioester hydrolase
LQEAHTVVDCLIDFSFLGINFWLPRLCDILLCLVPLGTRFFRTALGKQSSELEAAEDRVKMAGSDLGDEAPRVWHKTSLRVPLYEVDLGQAVYHGNYFHLLELAREGFLRDLGYPYRRFMDEQLHLTVVEASCSYRRSLHYDDLIEVHTGVPWWRRRSMAFAQAIYRSEGEQAPTLCTRATLNMVCVRFTGQPTTLPAEFATLLKEWAKHKE